MNGAKYILCSGRLPGICSELYPVNLFSTGPTDSRALLFVTPLNMLLPRNHCVVFKHAHQSKQLKAEGNPQTFTFMKTSHLVTQRLGTAA